MIQSLISASASYSDPVAPKDPIYGKYKKGKIPPPEGRSSGLMLTPLNRLEIDAILNHLPQRAELTKEADAILHRLQNVIDLVRGSEPADAEADTAVGALVAVSQCAQDVRGLETCACTG